MRTMILAIFVSLSYLCNSQDISGKWYSEDSTRIYHIYKKDNHFQASLLSSKRIGDKPGFPVLQNIVYDAKRNKHSGGIFSTEDSSATFVKISYDNRKNDVLKLRLHRFFFMNFNIRWYRVKESELVLH